MPFYWVLLEIFSFQIVLQYCAKSKRVMLSVNYLHSLIICKELCIKYCAITQFNSIWVYFTQMKNPFSHVRVLFAKFLDSPYCSESELCAGAVTVSFSGYPPWQALHFLQRSTHFSKTCCRPLITSKFLASEIPFLCCKRPEIAWGEIWTVWRMFK
jgi:hypothetical protein